MSLIVTPAQFTADMDDFTCACFEHCDALLISTDQSRRLTGLDASNMDQPARKLLKLIWNVGGFDVVLGHLDSGSSSANQFKSVSTSADVTLTTGQKLWTVCDTSAGFWRI